MRTISAIRSSWGPSPQLRTFSQPLWRLNRSRRKKFQPLQSSPPGTVSIHPGRTCPLGTLHAGASGNLEPVPKVLEPQGARVGCKAAIDPWIMPRAHSGSLHPEGSWGPLEWLQLSDQPCSTSRRAAWALMAAIRFRVKTGGTVPGWLQIGAAPALCKHIALSSPQCQCLPVLQRYLKKAYYLI